MATPLTRDALSEDRAFVLGLRRAGFAETAAARQILPRLRQRSELNIQHARSLVTEARLLRAEAKRLRESVPQTDL